MQVLLIPELPFTHRGLAFGPKGYKCVSFRRDAVECSSLMFPAASVTSYINSLVVYALILHCVTQHFVVRREDAPFYQPQVCPTCLLNVRVGACAHVRCVPACVCGVQNQFNIKLSYTGAFFNEECLTVRTDDHISG